MIANSEGSLVAAMAHQPVSFPSSPVGPRNRPVFDPIDECARAIPMRTYSPKASEIHREWHVVDAEGMVLGRLCTEVARLLRGKHKPIFAPHIDTGDHVIVINASKVKMTSSKADRQMLYRHSGYPGGIKSETFGEMLARKPEDAIRRSVKGMIPKGPLGRETMGKLKVYSGSEHPHKAQNPQPFLTPGAAVR